MKQTLLAMALVLAACGPKKMDQETMDYAPSVEFHNARLSAAENTVGQTVYTLRIAVVNKGNRTIKDLQVVLFFYDQQGKVVNTERATAVSSRYTPLPPGGSLEFKHGFDPPADWNRTSPAVGIAYMELK